MFSLGALVLVVSGCDDGGTTFDAGSPDAEVHLGDAGVLDAGALDAGAPDAGLPQHSVLETIDLGEHDGSDVLTLTIPEGTYGAHLVAARVDEPSFVGFARVTDPSGADVVRDYSVLPGMHQGAAGYGGLAAATLPQWDHPDAPLMAGDYAVELGAPGARVHVTATLRVGTTPARVLDVHVYVAEGLTLDGTPIDADSALDHAGLAGRLDSFFATLDSLFGVGRGRIVVHALDAEHATIADEDQLARVLASRVDTTGEPAPGFHVFLADGVTIYGTTVWGVAAAIPGASTDTLGMSGVALNVGAGFGAEADGMTLVHELGHFVGLFHSSEIDGQWHDVLSDTPECTLASGFGGCPDAHNIMHAVFYGASGGGIGLVTSPHQRRVFEASPIWRVAEPAERAMRQIAIGALPPAPPDLERRLRRIVPCVAFDGARN
ncbi:MAG: hypothetical protein AB7S26_26050 [Sandaracinaceae bacterium]